MRKAINRRLTEAQERELANDDSLSSRPWPTWCVDALQRAIPQSRDIELRKKPYASARPAAQCPVRGGTGGTVRVLPSVNLDWEGR
jgi:hypothetical protein